MAFIDPAGEQIFQPKGTSAALQVTNELPPTAELGGVGPAPSPPPPPQQVPPQNDPFSGAPSAYGPPVPPAQANPPLPPAFPNSMPNAGAQAPLQPFGPPIAPGGIYGGHTANITQTPTGAPVYTTTAPGPSGPVTSAPVPYQTVFTPQQQQQLIQAEQQRAQEYIQRAIQQGLETGTAPIIPRNQSLNFLAPQYNQAFLSPEGGQIEGVKPLSYAEYLNMTGTPADLHAQGVVNNAVRREVAMQAPSYNNSPAMTGRDALSQFGVGVNRGFNRDAWEQSVQGDYEQALQQGVEGANINSLPLWQRGAAIQDVASQTRDQFNIAPPPPKFNRFLSGLDTVLGKPLDYVSELGADVTPALARYVAPEATTAYDFLQKATGLGPDLPGFMPSLRETGETLTDYEGAVGEFRSRPLSEQLIAGTVFDPTNAVPAGFLPDIGRGIGAGIRAVSRGNEAVDNLARAGVGKLSDAFRPGGTLAGETGAVNLGVVGDIGNTLIKKPTEFVTGPIRPNLTLRTLGAGLGAGVGYNIDDDASLEDKVQNAILGGLIGAASPEITSTAARVGGLPQKVVKGVTGADMTVGRGIPNDVMNLPDADGYKDSLLAFKDFSGDITPSIGRRTKKVTTNALGFLDPAIRTKAVDNPKLPLIMDAHNFNEENINKTASYLASTFGNNRTSAGLEVTDTGALLVNGRLLPEIDPNTGLQVTPRGPGWLDGGTEGVGAGIADVRQVLEKFPQAYDEFLTPDQIRVIKGLDSLWEEIRHLRIKLNLPTAEFVDGYFPRGAPRKAGTPYVQRVGRMDFPEGRIAGSAREREFMSQAAGIRQGMAYPNPEQAVFETISNQLNEINTAWTNRAIEALVGPDGKPLGAANASVAEKALQNIRGRMKPITQQEKKLQATLRRLNSQQYFNSRSLNANANRLERLFAEIAQGQEDDVTVALSEAIAIARETIRGALTQSNEVRASMVRTATREGSALEAMRRNRKPVLDAARELDRLDSIVKQIEEGLGDPGSIATIREAPVQIRKAWEASLNLRKNSLRQMTKLESTVLGGEIDAARVAQAKLDLATFREQYGSLKASIRENLETILSASNKRTKEAVKTAVKQERADALGKQAAKQAQKAEQLDEKIMVVQDEIAQLRKVLAPQEEQIAELKKQIAIAKAVADTRSTWSTGRVQYLPMNQYPVPEQWANYINQRWLDLPRGNDGKVSRFKFVFDALNNIYRTMGAGLDVAGFGTVGMTAAVDNPGIASRAFAAGLESMDVAGRKGDAFYLDFLTDVNEWAKAADLPPIWAAMGKGLEIGTPETMLQRTAIDNPTVVERIANLPGYKQGSQFFDASSNIQRVLTFYDNLETLRAAGRDPHALSSMIEAGNAANLITGRARRGLIPGINADNNGRILFAARYTRSFFELLANAVLSGGLEGDTARRALLRGAGLMGASAWLISEATGYEWDPKEPFKTRVMDYNIDLAGPWGTFLDRLSGAGEAAAEGDWGGVVDQAERFGMGKLAPLFSMGLTALGKDLGDIEVPAVWEEGAKSLDYALRFVPGPFFARDIAETAPSRDWSDPMSWAEQLFGAGISIVGIKNNQISDYQVYLDDANEAYGEYEPLEYNRLEGWGAEDDPLYRHRYEEANPNARPEPTTSDGKTLLKAKDEHLAKLNGFDQRLINGDITIDEWKELIKIENARYRQEIKPITDGFKRNESERGSPAWWVDTYYSLYDQATDANGEVDFDKFNMLVQDWMNTVEEAGVELGYGAGAGEDALQYVRELGLTNDSEKYQEYQRAMWTLADGGFFDPAKLPRYENLETDDQQLILDILSKYNSWTFPADVKEAPVDQKIGWFMENVGVNGMVFDAEDEQAQAVYRDVLRARAANETLERLKQGKELKPGTIAGDGAEFLTVDYWEFVRDHADELKWFQGTRFYPALFAEDTGANDVEGNGSESDEEEAFDEDE